jgi:hypothetical protein
MSTLKTVAATALAAFVVLSLGACGKKKNGSTASAATPGSACVNNNGTFWTNSQGQICTPGAQSITCPANGIYTNSQGQVLSCTPGQQVNTGGFGYGGNYPYQVNPYNQTVSCEQYYYQYGVQYVPIYSTQQPYVNQYVCVRYDLVNGYANNTSYFNNYDMFYYYPPYTGSNCGSSAVSVNLGWFSGSLCF